MHRRGENARSDPQLSSQSRFGQPDVHFYCTGTAKTNFLHGRNVFEKPQKPLKTTAPAQKSRWSSKSLQHDGNLTILTEKSDALARGRRFFKNSRAPGRRTTEKHLSGTSRTLPRHLPGAFPGASRAPPGHFPGVSRAPPGHLSGTSRAPPGHLPSTPGRVTRTRALLRHRIYLKLVVSSLYDV